MHEAWLPALAVACSLLGMGWLALAMDVHWAQVRGAARHPVIALRASAAIALAGSLGLCLAADHASIAVLVWIMSLTLAAFAVAFTLSARPRWLAWMAWPWVR